MLELLVRGYTFYVLAFSSWVLVMGIKLRYFPFSKTISKLGDSCSPLWINRTFDIGVSVFGLTSLINAFYFTQLKTFSIETAAFIAFLHGCCISTLLIGIFSLKRKRDIHMFFAVVLFVSVLGVSSLSFVVLEDLCWMHTIASIIGIVIISAFVSSLISALLFRLLGRDVPQAIAVFREWIVFIAAMAWNLLLSLFAWV